MKAANFFVIDVALFELVLYGALNAAITPGCSVVLVADDLAAEFCTKSDCKLGLLLTLVPLGPGGSEALDEAIGLGDADAEGDSVGEADGRVRNCKGWCRRTWLARLVVPPPVHLTWALHL